MSLSRTKSQNLFMTAILVSAVTLCCSAEAKPKGGSKPLITEAMRDITIHKVTEDSFGTVACYAHNNNPSKDICAVFEYYNSNWGWWFGIPPQATRVQRRMLAREFRRISSGASAPSFQRQSLHCKLVSAYYIQPDPAGKDLFICPY